MKKTVLSEFLKTVQTTATKYSPEILTGIGITGMWTTAIFTGNATLKASHILKEEKYRRLSDAHDAPDDNGYVMEPEPISKLDTVKMTWKCYIPVVISGAISTACLICASREHSKRNAALATAYKLSERALIEYKDKVVETVGEKKEKVINDKIAQDRVDALPVSKTEVIITGEDEQLFLDYASKRYFKSSVNKIKNVQNILNSKLIREMYVSLSDYYDEIGLSHTGESDYMGWNISRDDLIEIDVTQAAVTEDGKACIVVSYGISPRYDFSKLG